ncbi:MAG: membrane protein insertion efficiency factor YidD [Endomicrobium sp.]|jgi:putative membrane protein insertion efficiency factor|nr:membrane protein insertion efficiency factor YidD [Endomicrobium sp.]
MKYFVLFFIKCYRFIFQYFPPKCRFYPTCSIYAYKALNLYGLFKGLYLTFMRIIRCNPFCSGGFDPIPLLKKVPKKNAIIKKD